MFLLTYLISLFLISNRGNGDVNKIKLKELHDHGNLESILNKFSERVPILYIYNFSKKQF